MTGNIRYRLCYDTVIDRATGARRTGSQELMNAYDRDAALSVARVPTQERHMSRTIRRKNVKRPKWFNEYSPAWEWHSDKLDGIWDMDVNSHVKAHTDRLRRADERIMIHNIHKDVDSDYYDRKKLYFHLWWVYD